MASTINSSNTAFLKWNGSAWEYSSDGSAWKSLDTSDHTLIDDFGTSLPPATVGLTIENSTSSAFSMTVSGDVVSPTGPQTVPAQSLTGANGSVTWACTPPSSSPGEWSISPNTPQPTSMPPTDPTFKVKWSRGG